MKIVNKFWLSLLWSVLTWTTYAHAEDPECSLEKKKNVRCVFTTTDKDKLLIDNQFGQVNINLWNKKEIVVEVSIRADANNDERTQCLLDAIKINGKRVDNQIVVQTIMNMNDCNSMWGNSKNTFRIDYTVSMPNDVPLVVKNKFGNTLIPSFNASLSVETKHGNFTAQQLRGIKNSIEMAFGTATIERIENGKFNMSHTNCNIEKGGLITLNNKFGNLKIGEVEKIEGQLEFLGIDIGTIKNKCNLSVSFSNNLKIVNLLKNVESVDINASHSSMTLPFNDSNCSFDVTVNQGKFNYLAGNKLIFVQNDDEQKEGKKRYGPQPKRQYVGRAGSGAGAKIRVVSTFGDINLK